MKKAEQGQMYSGLNCRKTFLLVQLVPQLRRRISHFPPEPPALSAPCPPPHLSGKKSQVWQINMSSATFPWIGFFPENKVFVPSFVCSQPFCPEQTLESAISSKTRAYFCFSEMSIIRGGISNLYHLHPLVSILENCC